MSTLEHLMHQLSVEPSAPTPPTGGAAQDDTNSSPNGVNENNTATASAVDTSKNDDEVFKATYIPFSLHEVEDPEREIELQKKSSNKPTSAAAGGKSEGTKQDLDALLPSSPHSSSAVKKSSSKTAKKLIETEESDSDSNSDSDDDSEEEEEEGEGESVHPKDAKLSKEDAKALKKEAKKATKEANREKTQNQNA